MSARDADFAALRTRVERLEAVAAVQSLIAAHGDLVSHVAPADVVLDACWAPGDAISIEVGASGVYSGRRKVSSYYEKDPVRGGLAFTILGAPDIAVAPDLQTAHGVWAAVGLDGDAGDLGDAPTAGPEERRLLTSVSDTGAAFRAELFWHRLEARFVLAERGWRLQSLHLHDIARHPFRSDWVSWAVPRFETDAYRLDGLFRSNVPFAPDEPPENNPEGPTTEHWQYTLDGPPPPLLSPSLREQSREESPS